ncbi:hypothetical protein [endosymbiont of Lamellibrachia barhami]|uniref:hypothetical protein n=1 Tax=endosymbiont of Lamellibrachia barhami TaxID=205975 RepID=UPI0015B23D3E|nr:hypothetical protein [endosymbiont of Lamellibrachia barhami]
MFDLNLDLSPNISLKQKNCRLVDLISKVVCFNQGKLAEYGYLAGEKHKALKDAMRGTGEKNKSDIKTLRDELTNYLNLELKNASDENFKFLKQYFEGRSELEPRICIKVHNEGKIVPLFRDRRSIDDESYPIEANTGFSEIANKTGYQFLCNNIPAAIKNNSYVNARINSDRVTHYKEQNIFERLRKVDDTDWAKCWNEVEGVAGERNYPPLETCYKSTLIIPMTLLNNTLSGEFIQRFEIEEKVSPRSIYGFLCFDHQEINYFNKKPDITIGYILADMLSLYLINSLTYVDYSTTFSAVEELLAQGSE